MQVSKSLLIVCASVICAGFISAHAQDNPAQAAARAALMEKMNELDGPQTPPPAAVPAEPPPAPTLPATTPEPGMAPIQTPEPATTMTPPPEKSSPVAPPVPIMMPPTNNVPVPPPSAPPAKPTAAKQTGNDGLQPIVAPPLPISMTKEEQLQALLEKYKADQITPQEYFKQRAAILAEP
jgi:outer membrane biosynthesis protein TonB